MTDSPLSRRHFFGATASVAVGTQFHALTVAAETKPSPLAPEPPLPPGVCQRLGSARFRELTQDFRFSSDSKWLAQFDGRQFIGYEVATGRRIKWQTHTDLTDDQLLWQMTTAGEVLAARSNIPEQPIYHFNLITGRERKGKVVAFTDGQMFTSDGTGLIQFGAANLWRTDLRTGKQVWTRKWKADASPPAVTFEVTERWIVAVGVKRLHLFDVRTGADGPRLEEALPKDAPPDNHFIPLNFSTDGKRVCGWFTADIPGRAVVWDLETGKVVSRLSPQTDATRAALSADGRHLFTTLPDEQDRLVAIDVRTGRVTRKLAARNVGSFVLSPDGKAIAALYSPQFRGLGGIDGIGNEPGGIVRLLNPDTGELLPQSPDPSAELNEVRFTDSHRVVVRADADQLNPARLLWNDHTGERRVLALPQVPVQYGGVGLGNFALPIVCEVSPDGNRYVAMSLDRPIVTDATTRRQLHTIPVQLTSSERPPFWVGRGRIGLLQSGQLFLWDLADRKHRIIPLKFATDVSVHGTVVTSDGRVLALTHWDKNLDNPPVNLTWVDVTTGDVKTTRGDLGLLTISARGNRVAVTGGAKGVEEWQSAIEIMVIDRDGWQTTFRTPSNTGSGISFGAELSPCGRTAVLAHQKRTDSPDEPCQVVQFWEVVSGELRAEFVTAHKAGGLGVSPCGRRIATTHRDAPIYLWDVFGEKSDPQPKPDKSAWDALNGSTDKAFTAIRQLVQYPTAAVELLSAKLTPAQAPKPEWVKARINNLGNSDFRTRHKAELDLSAVADVIAEPLRVAFDAGADSQEAHERLERLLQRASGVPAAAIRTVRAVEVLEYCDVPSAGVLLKKLTGGVESAVLTREAKAAVKRRGERPA